jgi:hypothetical protein
VGMHLKNKFRIILALLTMAVMFILMPRAIFAAMGNVSGTVTDGTNPIPEVSISLVTFDDGHTESVVSSVYGTYSFSNIPVATGYKMYFNKAGYKEVLKSNVEVKDEETTTVDAVLSASPAPTISGAALSLDNRYITITFSEGVWGDNRHLNPVTVDDFNFYFDRNGGAVTNATLTELKTTADTPLSGGESSIRFFFSLTGGPARGAEKITITARTDSIYNKDGTAMSAYQTTGEQKLYDKAPPQFDKGYPKAGDPHSAGSKRVSLKVKPYGEAVKMYYVVVTNEADAPNTSQVMNGKDSSGDDALAWGNHDVKQIGLGIRSIAPLPADDTDYDAYIVIVDTAGNATVPVRVDVRTPIKLLAQDYPKVGETQAAGSQKVEILNKANGKTTAYYVVVPEDAPAPSKEQIVAGENNGGSAPLASGSVSLNANEEKSSVTAALGADSTTYDVYMVLHHIYIDDITGINYGEIYSEVVKLNVTTPPAAPDPPTLQSAIVNANGDVELTFDKAMTDPADSAGGFLVCRDDGISRTVTIAKLKTGDTKTIELILTSKILGGEVFYISYIPMADKNVEAADGGVLAGFSPRLIVNNLLHPVLDTDDPPTGTVGTLYSYTLTATGGTGSYAFYLNGGSLPPGLELDNNSGVLSGTPTTTGSYTFTIMAIDGNSAFDKHDYTLIINEASDTTPPAAASNVTTIKVKSGNEAIVTAVDNNAGTESIIVANGTILGILMDAIESTDGSVQAYGLKRRDSYIVNSDTTLLTNDILEVTAENDSIKKQYTIIIAKVPTTYIAISGSGDASSVKKGRTLQMNVAVLPSNATDKTVTWSVENKTGNASISDTGLLTAISVGTVTVKATANDGSGIEANKDITITATSGKTKQTGFFAILATEKGVVPQVIPPIEAGLPVLTDISNHWAKGSIEYLIKGGTIVGYPDNTFKPDNPITRAEFTALLVKTFDLTADSGKVFEDTSGHWAKNYISTAAAYGIILGYNDKGFGPDDVITREQMVVMITRAAHLSDVSDTLQFTDSDHISSWAREAISSVTAQQIITGYTDNTFRPGNLATRAEAVTILLRIKDM